MPFLTAGGVSLRWDRAGSGPAVLLIHGWNCNRTFWERQVTHLRDRFTVVTVDLRGHGESSRPQKGYSIGALAGDLEQLVRALRVPRIALVGWSMGGMVALELARRLGDRASALGLVGTTPGGLGDPKSPFQQTEVAARMRAGVAEDFRGFAREFVAGCFAAGRESPLYPWALGQVQKTAPQVAAACLEALLAFDARAQLKQLKLPTTVVHGRGDQVLPLAGAEHLAKHITGAELVVLEQSAHCPLLEEPERFNETLLALLGR